MEIVYYDDPISDKPLTEEEIQKVLFWWEKVHLRGAVELAEDAILPVDGGTKL